MNIGPEILFLPSDKHFLFITEFDKNTFLSHKHTWVTKIFKNFQNISNFMTQIDNDLIVLPRVETGVHK